MTARQLVLRALAYYWRSNLAVVAGVATAVAVLAGALLVGDSVRGSLSDLVLQRIGRADAVVTSTGFFREALADEMIHGTDAASKYQAAAPLIVLQGVVGDPASGRRVSQAAVYGVDDRFWAFHGVDRRGPSDRDAFVSRALAEDLGVAPGAAVLVRIARPTAIPIDSLHGSKEDPGRSVRLTVRDVLDAAQMGDFSIQPSQGRVRAIFVPLARLQQDLDRAGRVNAVIVAGDPASFRPVFDATLERAARPEDYGLKVRSLEAQHAVALESDSGLLDFARTSAANAAADVVQLPATPVLTYLANTLRSGDREVPYSLVTATDLARIAPQAAASDPSHPPIVINEWTAQDLGAKPGDPLTLEFYVWQEPGYLETRTAEFRIAAVVPIADGAADRDLAPDYPGITEADTLGDWDPPFPIDLKRVRPKDEDYWKQYRTTPKAFIPYEEGRRIWGSPRYGDRTSIRIHPLAWQPLDEAARQFSGALMLSLKPAAGGFAVMDVRGRGLAASRGSTDFGEYFLYFSFFLVVSALVLAALFFRLSVEQRAREIGLLRAVGYTTRRVRRLFTTEGLLLAIAGSVFGIAGALGYGWLMMTGLRTWWSGAVGTRELTLHVSAMSLAAGAAGAVLAAVVCIWWTLRSLSRLSERDLVTGRVASGSFAGTRRSTIVLASAAGLAVSAAALIAAAAAQRIDPAGAFFGAGAAILGAGLCAITAWLRRPPHSVEGRGWTALARIGLRNATARPGRSVLAMAVIASAAFIVISVDAFRRGGVDPADRHSGTGGFPLLIDLDLPLVHDPNGRDGREALGLEGVQGVTFVPFRLLPGEDASCLNLYQPVSPRILGAPRAFLESGRFSFQSSLAATDADRANPWRLLDAAQPDGTIPVFADANSMTYVLHKALGDVIPLARGDRTLQLKLVGALADSIFQSELLMSETNFTRLFPDQQGYRLLLADVAADAGVDRVATAIEAGASDFGADAIPTAARLAEFHAVENTYLSTFQTLGGLGLLVGTLGLAAVLLRNVLERRRELALLRAVGYQTRDLFVIVVAENGLLLGCGLGLGAIAAAVAVGPAALARGARLPLSPFGLGLLLAVLAAGLLSSLLATRAALRAPLVASLRSD